MLFSSTKAGGWTTWPPEACLGRLCPHAQPQPLRYGNQAQPRQSRGRFPSYSGQLIARAASISLGNYLCERQGREVTSLATRPRPAAGDGGNEGNCGGGDRDTDGDVVK